MENFYYIDSKIVDTLGLRDSDIMFVFSRVAWWCGGVVWWCGVVSVCKTSGVNQDLLL